jgi:hypothetical protein
MSKPFHVTVFDNFHRGDPAPRVIGTCATIEETIALVKRRVDRELEHFWSEICVQDGGRSTLDRLVSQYNTFAEVPVAFDEQGTQVFDTAVYMKSRAAEIVAAAETRPAKEPRG